jgi:large subunit ribosomal protein L30e
MAKKEIEGNEKELKIKVQEGNAIIGADRVLKSLKSGSLAKIFLASNCRVDLKADIEHYAKISGVPVVSLEMNNEELGVFCKKNFFIAIVGVGA